MNPGLQTASGYVGSGALSEARNRVLRNTYWLLALSMVPTVLGAWIGVTTGIASLMSPGISLVVFLAGAFEMALSCDITVAAEGTRFGEPEVRFGSGMVALLLPWPFILIGAVGQ